MASAVSKRPSAHAPAPSISPCSRFERGVSDRGVISHSNTHGGHRRVFGKLRRTLCGRSCPCAPGSPACCSRSNCASSSETPRVICFGQIARTPLLERTSRPGMYWTGHEPAEKRSTPLCVYSRSAGSEQRRVRAEMRLSPRKSMHATGRRVRLSMATQIPRMKMA